MEWPAQEYEKFQKSHQYQYGLQLLSRLEIDVVFDQKSIVDLGCGTGDLALLLLGKVGSGGRITAIDEDQRMIGAFRDKPGSEDIEIIQANFVKWIEVTDIRFDIIVSNAAFHWLRTYEELQLVFRNCYRCLRSGGSFAFRFSLSGNGEKAKGFLEESLREYLDQPELKLWRTRFEFENCLSLLEESHFSITHTENLRYLPFTKTELSFDWMIKSQPILSHIKKGDFEDFKRFLWLRWSKSPFDLECHHGLFLGRKD